MRIMLCWSGEVLRQLSVKEQRRAVIHRIIFACSKQQAQAGDAVRSTVAARWQNTIACPARTHEPRSSLLPYALTQPIPTHPTLGPYPGHDIRRVHPSFCFISVSFRIFLYVRGGYFLGCINHAIASSPRSARRFAARLPPTNPPTNQQLKPTNEQMNQSTNQTINQLAIAKIPTNQPQLAGHQTKNRKSCPRLDFSLENGCVLP